MLRPCMPSQSDGSPSTVMFAGSASIARAGTSPSTDSAGARLSGSGRGLVSTVIAAASHERKSRQQDSKATNEVLDQHEWLLHSSLVHLRSSRRPRVRACVHRSCPTLTPLPHSLKRDTTYRPRRLHPPRRPTSLAHPHHQRQLRHRLARTPTPRQHHTHHERRRPKSCASPSRQMARHASAPTRARARRRYPRHRPKVRLRA